MRRVFQILFLVILPSLLSSGVRAADSKNFFDMLARTPQLAVVKVQGVKQVDPQSPNFIHELQVEQTLVGEAPKSSFSVLQESLFPGTKAWLDAGDRALVFLAPLQDFTAYQSLKRAGVGHRFFGDRAGALALPDGGEAEVLGLTQSVLEWRRQRPSLTQKISLLVRALTSSAPRIREDAAFYLRDEKLTRSALPSEDVAVMTSVIRSPYLLEKPKLALIQVLEMTQQRDALISLFSTISGKLKWASAAALQNLGVPRETARWLRDYEQASPADREAMLPLMARDSSAEMQAFVQKFLSGAAELPVKNRVIEVVAKNPAYHALLLKQLDRGDETIAAFLMLALVKAGNLEVTPKILAALDSPSEKIRAAAIFALRQSSDPRAQRVWRERYEDSGATHMH